MEKRIFLAGTALLAAGGLALLIAARDDAPPAAEAPIAIGPQGASVALSERALALHDRLARQVGAQTDPTTGIPGETSRSAAYPAWLQTAVDRGLIDERYVDLWLEDDYLDVVQQRFYVLQRDRQARENDGCDLHEVEGGQPVCWNEWGYDPYLGYGLDTLEAMAETDAPAAAALALRLGDRETSLYYALRAATLSGRPGPLVRFLSSRNEPADDPDRHRRQLLESYVLALLIDDMGYPYRHSTTWAYSLRREGLSSQEIDAALVSGLKVARPLRVGP